MVKRIHQLFRRFILFMVVCATSCTPSDPSKPTLNVFAAASLGELMQELGDQYESESGIRVSLNLASSGTLARQIEQGAKADLYLSANQTWTDYLEKANLLQKTITLQASNQLALIAPTTSSLSEFVIEDKMNPISLPADGKVSIGDPAHVPVGAYAKQAFTYLGWQQALQPNLILAKDARAALSIVELDEVSMGIVYRSDALQSKKVKILSTFPHTSHTPIQYFAGTCSPKTEAVDFLIFINSENVRSVWKKHGFTI